MARSSQLAGEGSVQQRLLQRLQRGELARVERDETLSCGMAIPQRGNSHQPRVAESARLPWVNPTKCDQPQRGCGCRRVHANFRTPKLRLVRELLPNTFSEFSGKSFSQWLEVSSCENPRNQVCGIAWSDARRRMEQRTAA